MRITLLILALLVLPSPVAAQPSEKLFTVSEWAVMASHGLDAASTQRCLGSGKCHELNHALARFDGPVAFTAAKVSVAAVQLWAVRKIKPSHPKLATVTNYTIAGAFTWIAIRNERIGR